MTATIAVIVMILGSKMIALIMDIRKVMLIMSMKTLTEITMVTTILSTRAIMNHENDDR